MCENKHERQKKCYRDWALLLATLATPLATPLLVRLYHYFDVFVRPN